MESQNTITIWDIQCRLWHMDIKFSDLHKKSRSLYESGFLWFGYTGLTDNQRLFVNPYTGKAIILTWDYPQANTKDLPF